MTTTAQSIREIVAEQLCLGCEAADHDSLSGQFGMDNLDRVEIIMAIEDDLGIELSDDLMDGFDTVWQLIEAVETTV